MTDQNTNLPVIVHRHVDETTKRFAMFGAAAACILSAAALVMVLRQPATPVFVSVSVKSLMEDHMMSVVGRDISQSEAETRTLEYLAAVETSIADLAGDDGVIVIAAEAVIGPSVPDFTSDIRIIARERSEAMARARGQSLPPLGDTSGVDRLMSDMAAQTDALTAELYPSMPETLEADQ